MSLSTGQCLTVVVTTANLTTLRDEVDALDKLLLAPVTSSPPDPLPLSERVGVRSYLLIGHAALEEFVESCFAEYVNDSLALDENGRVDPGLYLSVLELREDLEGQVKRDIRTPSALLEKVPGLYKSKICGPNNGVRRKNLMRLAQGAGLDWVQFESACEKLVVALDTIGSERGRVAHTSATPTPGQGVTAELYPQNVREFVNNAMDELPSLVTYLNARPRTNRLPISPLKRYTLKLRAFGRWFSQSLETFPHWCD